MNPAATQEPQPWTARRWWIVAALALLAHLALIFIFGDKKGQSVRPVSNVPHLQLAAASDEFITLNDPTLFALPHARDFAAPDWMRATTLQPPSFQWTEPPRWLPLAAGRLGTTFGHFMQTNRFTAWSPDFKPPPLYSQPALPVTWSLPRQSSLRLRGELARRALLAPLPLPNWPEADVIAPSKVQVVVNPAGQVVSAVLLPPDYGFETTPHDDLADQRALGLARGARFAPAPGLSVGQMIFNWHTVPLSATNAPVNLP